MLRDPLDWFHSPSTGSPDDRLAAAMTLAAESAKTHESARWELARLPNAPSAGLTALAGDSSEVVRAAVAANPNTPPDVLRAMYPEPSPVVCMQFASNPSSPEALLRLLLKRVDAWLEEGSVFASDMAHHLACLATTPGDVIQDLCGRSWLETMTYEALLEHPALTVVGASKLADGDEPHAAAARTRLADLREAAPTQDGMGL